MSTESGPHDGRDGHDGDDGDDGADDHKRRNAATDPPARYDAGRRTRGSRGWYVLLLAPFVGMLWVPLYNRVEPRAGSIPFFYWYQFVWIGVSAVLTAVVYFATRNDAER
jgi:hypothetical protein